MKLFVSMDEVKAIVTQTMKDRGFTVRDPVETTETHGQYEDAVTVTTGLSFDLVGVEQGRR